MSAAKQRLYWRLQLAAHYLQKMADRELQEKANISTAQTGVLTVIANGTDVTQKQVADRLGLNESAVTAMVRKLIALEYVERHRSEVDARAYVLTLTPQGQHIQSTVRAPFGEINKRIESVLSPEEIDDMSASLEKLTALFKD